MSLSKSDAFSVRWVQDNARHTVFFLILRTINKAFPTINHLFQNSFGKLVKNRKKLFRKAFENILDSVPGTKRVKMTVQLFLLD